jgi:hypothetical protein
MMSDPRFDDSELPAKPDRTLKDRGDRFGLVVASAAVAGVVVMGVLYTLMSERLKPTPKPSVESNQTSQAPAPPGQQK